MNRLIGLMLLMFANCVCAQMAGGIMESQARSLGNLLPTTSAALASILTDETGTGSAVFANTPNLVTPNIGAATGTSLSVSGPFLMTGASNYLAFDSAVNSFIQQAAASMQIFARTGLGSSIDFYSGTTVAAPLRWSITSAGNLIAGTDNTYDIGTNSATRPRTVYVAQSVATPSITFAGFTFANLSTALAANGMMGYCTDCTIANPCAGSGTGAMAKRLNGVYVCN